MIAASLVLSLYFTTLLSFSFITHPVGYCYLLLLSAFSVIGYVYLVLGFSWYLVLFCLVYVGGVYVLFIFVSMHNPNPSPMLGGSYGLVLFVYFFLAINFVGYFTGYEGSLVECSHYLCSYFEGITYLFFCTMLMLGFVIVSIVGGEKCSFYR
uniref:NADH dehydrogenase subunit 6 n=1 Tax=Haplorchis taichui TaxID=235153 RepID=U3MGW6_9TREM|nr:NADH dehydrogenase subunit 6 [Haplorchis taichui]AGW07007.1 NADH dehydrogenase subunit 6 [Haplorchis taichui]AYV63043.1 NADH dehydrogenase subunit 6 [Haplorchis taichui]